LTDYVEEVGEKNVRDKSRRQACAGLSGAQAGFIGVAFVGRMQRQRRTGERNLVERFSMHQALSMYRHTRKTARNFLAGPHLVRSTRLAYMTTGPKQFFSPMICLFAPKPTGRLSSARSDN
jgi:hypothetical protein